MPHDCAEYLVKLTKLNYNNIRSVGDGAWFWGMFSWLVSDSEFVDCKSGLNFPDFSLHICGRHFWHGAKCYQGWNLTEKSPRATWAHNEKNLRAQRHIHEPNFAHEISIFISIPYLNTLYHLNFAGKRHTAVESDTLSTSALKFWAKSLTKSYLCNYNT